jgi:hypothetical protein
MQKIIWACWFQGRDAAPELVRKCLQSWEERNPGWELRCLDSETVSKYVNLSAYVDLNRQKITAASLSDILRVLLLHEFGGVWVDATTYCNVPLDDWLPPASCRGFFAFSEKNWNRLLHSWFLAAEPGNPLLAKWAARIVRYWQGRERTQDYFWMHRQFAQLCTVDKEALLAWQAVPRIDGIPIHVIQAAGMLKDFDSVKSKVDWTLPLFKLTRHFDASALTANSLVARLLNLSDSDRPVPPVSERAPQSAVPPIGMLKVSTDNVGDHIQIMAAESLYRRAGLVASFTVDRDEEITESPPVPSESKPGILLNGWYKHNAAKWPPHCAYSALYVGFHISVYELASLLSRRALEHYAAHGPVGCRDRETLSLLRSNGIEAFLSNCPTITFPKRLPDADRQTEIFVVSRDRKILSYLPPSIGPYTYISHYSESRDFSQNKYRATELLTTYRERAKLIVTTMLHCALPAIAMGIPVVVFYPRDEVVVKDDMARFSSLCEIVRVFSLSEANLVDWRGYSPDVSTVKLRLIETFCNMAERWGQTSRPPIGPIAPSTELPFQFSDVPCDPERLDELIRTKSPDRHRWGAPSSYDPNWADRSRVAAQLIQDRARVLEVGTGLGTLRALIADRCNYTGADLQPLDDRTLAIDLESDPIPHGSWDTIVLLGVVEYLYRPFDALRKAASAASNLIISYGCCVDEGAASLTVRRGMGWTNSMTERDLTEELGTLGFRLHTRHLLNSTPHYQEIVFQFVKQKVDFTTNASEHDNTHSQSRAAVGMGITSE